MTKFRRKPHKCSNCGSTRVASICYGMPVFSDDLKKDLDDGRVVFGGCCVVFGAPRWQCAQYYQ